MDPTPAVSGLSFNWYDMIVLVALLYGLWSGSRTGLSGEIIRVLALLLMVALGLNFYQPVGAWLAGRTGLVPEVADLVAFVGIAVLVYALSLGLRAAVQRRTRKLAFGVAMENTGGALAGLLRMAVIMAWITVIFSLMRSPFWHKHVSHDSAFGSFVVGQFPAVKAVTEKQFPETFLLFRDLNRPDDPDIAPDRPKTK